MASSSSSSLPAAWAAAVRAGAVAPALRAAVWACLAMSAMLVAEAAWMGLASLAAAAARRLRGYGYRWEPMAAPPDVEAPAPAPAEFPMVYKLSIGAACALTWPPDRIIIQVLDDSTDPFVKELVELECKEWASKKINIKMFLTWPLPGDFAVNYNVCLMTRIQKMSLDYHFKVEQESGSFMHAFFGFNGTAGVWRVSAINQSGGWKDRTTVEDMDLAVRASLKGWEFLYVGDIRVKSELPSTFQAYRHQQHRWTCGAANLFRKMAWEIITNKEVSMWKKHHLLYSFFFVRRAIAPILTFLFYCIVIPLSAMVPEVTIPVWGLVYIPTAITIMNAIRNPGSVHLMPFWILFENVMAMHRMRAALSGLLETARANDWVVTEKVGDQVKDELDVPLLEPLKPTECAERIYIPELLLALYLLICASYDFVLGNHKYYIYIYLQAVAFTVMGFGFVGTRTPCS
uniref:Glycosyltransferase 2-like domain-containing protein n=1 Tax=Oryza barthii TaxID=65489 RepID=A0A0D3HDH8_9ORYZ